MRRDVRGPPGRAATRRRSFENRRAVARRELPRHLRLDAALQGVGLDVAAALLDAVDVHLQPADLARAVHLYQRRLEENEAEKARIERELREAKAKLAAADGDGAPSRNPYDLTQDDWKELAKTGSRLRVANARGPDGRWCLVAFAPTADDAAELQRTLLSLGMGA